MTFALPDTFAIVGAGPAGLVTARAFLNYGLKVEILERHSAVGGIWDKSNPGSPVYESCHFISSRDYGGFIGYPMPSTYPLYPKWHQIRDYVRSFADAFGLTAFIRTDSDVVSAVPVDTDAGRYWAVALGSGETRNYRGVVSATGGQWVPVIPKFAGSERFTGIIIHSSEYDNIDVFRGKNVLVVGAGNSGVDIAADAAFMAEKAVLSTRRGYWFLPKLAYGVPVGDLLQGNIPDEKLPAELVGLDSAGIIQKVLDAVVGDVTNYGLPAPDHPLGATHPITNFQVLHALAHGLLSYRPNIREITPTGVIFEDDSFEAIDVIVLSTGYDNSIPWLPEGTLEYEEGQPKFLLGALVDNVEGLYGAGVLHFAGNTYPVFDQLVQLAAADAKALVSGENRSRLKELRASYRPSFKHNGTFLDVRRNANHVDIAAVNGYLKELEEDFGVPVPYFNTPEFYV
ncbi:NAD(P)/FAD-dependent oxidoreductase [Cryobacterium gelidum]|uniref:4-hydroxybenzoate brominase (decarboxylating) n=2 Tax=Cryobacterium gelidum TaxID=1259164 RepID=A0A4R9ASA5_9MICO|nr:NAD(P)/FAD-dependent oxidoreductase [Cryobacterium gelidum]TFD68162.1 NAD(P)/FAD-dependent oxidoreductase [Cryobacterium gelidum]